MKNKILDRTKRITNQQANQDSIDSIKNEDEKMNQTQRLNNQRKSDDIFRVYCASANK